MLMHGLYPCCLRSTEKAPLPSWTLRWASSMHDSTCARPNSSKPRCPQHNKNHACMVCSVTGSLLGLLVHLHLQCAPPSLLCYQTLRDMVNYERSSAGATCAGFREDAEAEANAALGQAKSQAFCHSACGVNASRYLKQMEDDGCVQWDAYRNAKVS